jgi:predicted alpha-1,2-mannosidase
VAVALAAGVFTVDSGAALGDFASGFESDDPRPARQGGAAMESVPRAEVAHSGTNALRYSGTAGSPAYNQVFDVDLAVVPATVLSYWVYPVTGGTGVAVDLVFTDGTTLRDSGAVDQHGARMHPRDQAAAGTLVTGRWNLVRSVIGERSSGKTVDRILIGHESGTGPFKGYLDDIAVQSTGSPAHLSDLVDTRRGSNSDRNYSRGNTFPATAVPNGFNFWTPITSANTGGWLYKYAAKTVQGFGISHEPSPWIGDYAQLQIMPMTGDVKVSPGDRKSAFDHANEIAQPHYYKTQLDTYGITTEMTPTDHAGLMRFKYPADERSVILFDTIDQAGGSINVDAAARRITGLVDHKGERLYFAATVDKAIEASGGGTGTGATAWVRFATIADEQVVLRLATSYISLEQATANLEQEVGGKTFDQVREEAATQWDALLGRARIEGAPLDRLVIFYSCLYRAFLYPNNRAEMGRYRSPYDGAIHTGQMYVNDGFWDTTRAVWPLSTLLMPTKTGEMLDGFVNAAKEGGWTPRWSAPGYVDSMVGTHQDLAFADAYLKGVRNFDYKAAYASMVKNAMVYSGSGSKGRKGLEVSTFKGYVPTDAVPESASWTLEDAANDFGIAQLARALGHDEDAAYFLNRSLSYVNLFSPTAGFFRGRQSSGAWRTPDAKFDPATWGFEFTEGDAWHYTMAAPQDPQGMAALYGGRAQLASKIDSVFAASREYRPGSYGRVIPEMLGAYDTGLGQYAHSNEPVHHMIYMYAYAGTPAKAQDRVRQVLTTLYDAGDGTGNGYLGDEDNGQMSAWYVFSALGFYPARLGGTEYTIGAPLHPKATLTLENGREFTISAPGVSDINRYIQSVRLNGERHTKNYLTHADITAGGTLTFEMGSSPSSWGTGQNDVPPSITTGTAAPRPLADKATGGTVGKGMAALVDDTSLTQWLSPLETATIEDRLAEPATIEQYTLTSAADLPERDPRSWNLQGSHDGKTWTTIDSRTGLDFDDRRQTRAFVVAHPGSYTSYRLQITAAHGASQIQLAEWQLLG